MRVTVGIPFLNAENTLADAIRSVFAQTIDDWELILLDDGSTDDSLNIASSVRDPRVKVISDGTNKGLHARLNQIADLASGKMLARMDSDDLMHPTRLQKQLQYSEIDKRLDVIGTGVYIINAETQPTEIRDTGPVDTCPNTVMAQSILAHPTVTGKTRWFRENPYDESFTRAEDYELWCRTYTWSRFGKIPEPLYYFREGAREPKKYLRDYIRTAQSVRKAMRIYAPAAIGPRRARRLIISSYLKETTYRMATAAGMQAALIDRRHGRPMHEHELKQAKAGLNAIVSTHVPGLPLSQELEERNSAWWV